ALENTHDWRNFLTRTQSNCEDQLKWVLVIEREQEELSMLVKLNPEVELINGMRFPVNDPKLFLNRHIRSFPRIRLNSSVQTLEFLNGNSGTLRQRPSEIKSNTLIPFSDLRHVETPKGDLHPKEWLDEFLQSRPKPVHSDQVKGILRESKGCYLFPGIPFNSITSIHVEGAKIHHVLRSGHFNLNNIPFKRMIEEVREEWMEMARVPEAMATKRQKISICCLGEVPVLNSILRIQLGELGYRRFSETTRLEPGSHELDPAMVWLKLSEFTGTLLKGTILDWSSDMRRFLKPLKRFVDLQTLDLSGTITSSPLMQIELEKQSLDLLRREKKLESERKLANNRLLLHSQEKKILEKAEKVSQILLQILNQYCPWENAGQLKLDHVNHLLLFCEEEMSAAQMTHELQHVQRKWWINPHQFQQPEHLQKLDPVNLKRYFEEGVTLATEVSVQHFLSLCETLSSGVETSSAMLEEQHLILENSNRELEKIRTRKSQLALHWLYVSLKQLLVRDLHLLPAGTV
ncbi:MAG: hypothetical protein VX059_08540, partial [SAR324 cluster bacterium]|nr:hypothetical protein [SAR324 cluster bacterium]